MRQVSVVLDEVLKARHDLVVEVRQSDLSLARCLLRLREFDRLILQEAVVGESEVLQQTVLLDHFQELEHRSGTDPGPAEIELLQVAGILDELDHSLKRALRVVHIH